MTERNLVIIGLSFIGFVWLLAIILGFILEYQKIEYNSSIDACSISVNH